MNCIEKFLVCALVLVFLFPLGLLVLVQSGAVGIPEEQSSDNMSQPTTIQPDELKAGDIILVDGEPMVLRYYGEDGEYFGFVDWRSHVPVFRCVPKK